MKYTFYSLKHTLENSYRDFNNECAFSTLAISIPRTALYRNGSGIFWAGEICEDSQVYVEWRESEKLLLKNRNDTFALH